MRHLQPDVLCGLPLPLPGQCRHLRQPTVINGCSDLMLEVFGEKGKHSRSAVGTNALPLGIPVEIEAIVEFE